MYKRQYQFPEKLIPLFINNIRHRKPLPVYGKGENVRDWLYVVDHALSLIHIFKIGILDLPRGKVFYYNNTLPEISMLVKSEAESLLKMLSSLEG